MPKFCARNDFFSLSLSQACQCQPPLEEGDQVLFVNGMSTDTATHIEVSSYPFLSFSLFLYHYVCTLWPPIHICEYFSISSSYQTLSFSCFLFFIFIFHFFHYYANLACTCTYCINQSIPLVTRNTRSPLCLNAYRSNLPFYP